MSSGRSHLVAQYALATSGGVAQNFAKAKIGILLQKFQLTMSDYKCILLESSFGRKCKCLLIVLAKLLYLDRVRRADFSGCHLEEIWLLVTGLFHLNGNMRKASAFLGESTKLSGRSG